MPEGQQDIPATRLVFESTVTSPYVEGGHEHLVIRAPYASGRVITKERLWEVHIEVYHSGLQEDTRQ